MDVTFTTSVGLAVLRPAVPVVGAITILMALAGEALEPFALALAVGDLLIGTRLAVLDFTYEVRVC